MKPCVNTTHSHKIYSRLTPTWHSRFPSSTLTAGMQPWIRVGVELFTRPFLPSLAPPIQEGSGNQTSCKVSCTYRLTSSHLITKTRVANYNDSTCTRVLIRIAGIRGCAATLSAVDNFFLYLTYLPSFPSLQMPVTTGCQKVRTNTMKAYHRPRQYINQGNVHSRHMTFRQTPLVLILPSLDNVLPAVALQNRVVWSIIGYPSYTSSQSGVRHILPILHLNLPSGLGRRVVGVVLTLLLLLSGDIETNPGPVGEFLC